VRLTRAAKRQRLEQRQEGSGLIKCRILRVYR
jgi:hypothetical protein